MSRSNCTRRKTSSKRPSQRLWVLSIYAAVLADKEPQGRNPFGGAAPTFTIGIHGQSFGVQVELLNQSPDPVNVETVTLAASDGKAWKISTAGDPAAKSVAGHAQAQARFTVTVPPDAALTRPYFSRPDEEQAYYDLVDPRYRNLSLAPYPLSATVKVSYKGCHAQSFAGSPNHSAHSHARHRSAALAGRSRDFRFTGAGCWCRAGRSQVVRVLVHRA